MKILTAIIALGLVIQSSHALTLNDLAGKWVGERIAKQNGKTQSQPTTFTFKKVQGGLVEHGVTQLTSGTLRYTGKYLPYKYSDGSVSKDRGTSDFFSTIKGSVTTVASGSWSFNRDTLRVYLSSDSDDRSSRTTFHLISKNVFVFAIQQSGGASVTGRFVRK